MKIIVALHKNYAETIEYLVRTANNAQAVLEFETIQLNEREQRRIAPRDLREDEVDCFLHELYLIKKERGLEENDFLLFLFDGTLFDAEGGDPYSVWLNSISDGVDVGVGLVSTFYLTNDVFKNEVQDFASFLIRYIGIGLLSALANMYLDLDYHFQTTGCVMDYCQNIKDLIVTIKKGFYFCDKAKCKQRLSENEIGAALIAITDLLNRSQFKSRESHQMMSRCFKIDALGCIKAPVVFPDQIFVAMPFKPELQDIFDFGIKPAVEKSGYEYWKADEHPRNIDLMCKICESIQASEYALVDLTEYNPNVYFELGLCYSLGRKVLIIKREGVDTPTDLRGMEHIQYKNASDLYGQLLKIMPKIFV